MRELNEELAKLKEEFKALNDKLDGIIKGDRK